jgi:hypothetical protein
VLKPFFVFSSVACAVVDVKINLEDEYSIIRELPIEYFLSKNLSDFSRNDIPSFRGRNSVKIHCD